MSATDYPYYRADLARVHHLGFGFHADACARGVLALLASVRERDGLVVELGCGSGHLTRHLLKDAHRVIATDASPAMLELTRRQAPDVEDLRLLVLPDDPIPAADAIVSVGHVLSYLRDESAIRRALRAICGALRPGGVLALDICDLQWGESRRNARPFASVNDEWVLVTMFSVPAPNRQAAEFPDSNRGWTPSVEPFRNNFLSPATKNSLWLLLAAVGFLLLIACANVANLLLARGTARQREVTVRTALGASQLEIARQLLTESLVLALVGGAVGIGLAFLVMRAVVALMPQFMLPSETVIELNVPVLLFTVALSVVSGVLFGTAPAWQAARIDLNEMLKESGRALHGGRHGLRRALVVLEVALALTLLTGGGVALWSFTAMARAELGFRTDHLLTFTLPVPRDKMVEPDTIRAFYDRMLTDVHALPGVRSAAVSTGLPLQGAFGMPFSIPGQPPVDAKNRPFAPVNVVTPEYLGLMGMRITRGRGITAADRQGGQLVAVVNETFVKRVFGATDPLTQRFELGRSVPGTNQPGEPQVWQIVGVVADSRSSGLKNDIAREIHLPFDQSPFPRVRMTVRSEGDPMALQKTIAAVIQRLDPDLPMGNVRTMDQVVAQTLVGDRFTTALFAGFAAVALILAALGIYGVMSFAVAQRTHEIGLRIALGAGRGRVLRQVLREGLLTALAGTILGSAGAWFVVRALRDIVFGVSAFAPAAFVGVTLVLLAAALVACLVPARRAASVDPMVALRQD